jgi:hypothetical protein
VRSGRGQQHSVSLVFFSLSARRQHHADTPDARVAEWQTR